jgi:branched-subunit amino acid transport protein
VTETARLWVTILLAGAGTFLARISFLGVAHRIADPPIGLQRVLRMIPPAALAALVLPALVRPDHHFDLTQPRFFAGVIATAVAFRTKNVLLTLVVGMAAVVIFDQL